MSFRVGCWLQGMWVRLSGKRPRSIGTAVRHQDKRRRCGLRPLPEALEPRETAAQSTVARWQARGVVVNKLPSAFVAPIYNTITPFPRTVLDLANGKIAVPHYNAAGIPQSASTTFQGPTQAAHVFGTPLALNQCNAAYVLPHADPSQWPASYQTGLIYFVNNGGWLYRACHSVSDRDVDVTRCLSTGLILYKVCSNGSQPCNYNPTT